MLPDATLDALQSLGLLAGGEAETVRSLFAPGSRFAAAVALAETVHLHVKVDDTHALPLNDFFARGARLDHQKDGFVKYRFPGGINAIFSHIAVAQDELVETPATRRARPFLDHVGIDLREETPAVRAAFDALPDAARELGWAHAPQGGPGKPVQCCHVEVAAKHWLYPRDAEGRPGIPLEFAYGPLTVSPGKSGCDLRPGDPLRVDAASIPCCAPAGDVEGSYYQRRDLRRFGEISRVNPALGEAFFAYYRQAMDAGALTRREKALVALAVAHALKCPYCIDAYTETLNGMQVGEGAMGEAVHVAAAVAAGVSLVHSTQMMNRLDALGRCG